MYLEQTSGLGQEKVMLDFYWSHTGLSCPAMSVEMLAQIALRASMVLYGG